VSKAKPCPKNHCGRPKMKGKQSCLYHWLLRQSSDVQAAHARARLEAWGDEPTIARVKPSEWPDGERWCAGCQSYVPLFYVTGSRCKACASMASHASRLESTYGIDAAEYERIFKLQGGRCFICRNRPASKRFAVDHDHQTGDVRGILCKRCNHDLLGGAHDGVALLWRAIGYLLFPPAQFDERPQPGVVIAALRAQLEAIEAEARPSLPEPVAPPF
jgi:hypothetical protein